MAIEAEHEPTQDFDPRCVERCCLCRTPTRHWYRAKNVACCPACAATARAEDIPDKAAWCAKECALNPPHY